MPKQYLEQHIQEEEYKFPYHYVSTYHPHFRPGFVDGWAMNYNLSIEMVIEYIKNENFKTIIDIGCGDGRLTKELYDNIPNATVTGIDYSNRAIELARALSPNIDFRKVDITDITSNLQRFDVGILMEVFEHIPPIDAKAFAKGIAELIEDNGLLIITVPHKNKPLEDKHFQHFDFQGLDSYFSDYFSVQEVIYIERIGIANRLLNSIVVNKYFILNSRKALNMVYRLYKKLVFSCDSEGDCARIGILYRRKDRGNR